MLALGRYEANICDCGVHSSLAGDKANNFFTFKVDTCPVCRGLTQFTRGLAESDQQAMERRGKDQPARAPQPSDGRKIRVEQLDPLQVAARRAKREGR